MSCCEGPVSELGDAVSPLLNQSGRFHWIKGRQWNAVIVDEKILALYYTTMTLHSSNALRPSPWHSGNRLFITGAVS